LSIPVTLLLCSNATNATTNTAQSTTAAVPVTDGGVRMFAAVAEFSCAAGTVLAAVSTVGLVDGKIEYAFVVPAVVAFLAMLAGAVGMGLSQAKAKAKAKAPGDEDGRAVHHAMAEHAAPDDRRGAPPPPLPPAPPQQRGAAQPQPQMALRNASSGGPAPSLPPLAVASGPPPTDSPATGRQRQGSEAILPPITPRAGADGSSPAAVAAPGLFPPPPPKPGSRRDL
jgi:hypothetical protein